MNEVFLALGSNVGDKLQNIGQAYELIEAHIGEIIKKSTIYESKPWGFVSENQFVNTVIKISTRYSPDTLLKELKKIEEVLGREKKLSKKYEDRIIDIDILFYGTLIYKSNELVIPHPEFDKRLFVLIPMNEIEKNYIDPLSNKKISEILKEKRF